MESKELMVKPQGFSYYVVFMSKIFQYLKEVKNELVKVVWPSRRDTVKMTLIVIVFSLMVSLFLGAIDYGLTKGLEQLLHP